MKLVVKYNLLKYANKNFSFSNEDHEDPNGPIPVVKGPVVKEK